MAQVSSFNLIQHHCFSIIAGVHADQLLEHSFEVTQIPESNIIGDDCDWKFRIVVQHQLRLLDTHCPQ